MDVYHQACRIILFLTSFIALYTCPHSKVEESFNLQASYDLFYFGIAPSWRLFIDERLSSCISREDGTTTTDTCSSPIDDDIDALLPYDHLQYPGGE